MGLCSQIDLDTEVQKAAARLERERAEQRKKLQKAGTLLPTSETVPGLGPQPDIDLEALLPDALERPARAAEKPEPDTDSEAEPHERDEAKSEQT